MSNVSLIPPMPEVEPLQLLYVTNGSPLTADLWWQAHRYYQHRQNLHYQSLHQPGIVRGLGVRVIPAPESVPSEVRDRRWIEIQPGIAIDLVGNPIVVDEPITFRITSEVIDKPITIYVVLAYVNPRAKQWSSIPTSVVKEEFRVNERKTPPASEEIELCRLQITSNTEALQDALYVMHPAPHELDLRHRQQVQVRSQQTVQIGLISQQPDSHIRDRLTALLQSLKGLYPPLAGSTTVAEVALETLKPSENAGLVAPEKDPKTNLSEMTLLVLPYAEAIALTENEINTLRQAIAHGSTVLIEYADVEDGLPPLGELEAVKEELLAALADLQNVEPGSELDHMCQALMAEVTACEAVLQERLHVIAHPIHPWAQSAEEPDKPVKSLPRHQPLATLTQVPFRFDELPHLPDGPIHLLMWDGVVLVMGSLSAAWTHGQFASPLPRETIRSAQELGVNILYQAQLRQQMVRAQQPAIGR